MAYETRYKPWPKSRVERRIVDKCEPRHFLEHLLLFPGRRLGLAGLLATWGPEGDEADALHLTDVVEADDADIGVRVLLLHLLHLIDDLRGVGAAEHGQLPHCPVPAVVVPGRVAVLAEDEADLAELEAGNPLGLDQEVDLLQELLHGERWQVRQGLELLDALNRPHLNI